MRHGWKQALSLTTAGAAMVVAALATAASGDSQEKSVTVVKEEQVRWFAEQEGISKKEFVLRGNLLLAGNELAKALMAFDKALEMDGEDTAAKVGRAIVLARQGKLDEAEQLLKQQLPLTPDPARVYLELGRIHEQRGEHAKALSIFKEGIKVYEQGRR